MVIFRVYKNEIRKEKELAEFFNKARDYSSTDSLTFEEKAVGLAKLEQYMKTHPLRPSPFRSLLYLPSRITKKIVPLSFRNKLNTLTDIILNDRFSIAYISRRRKLPEEKELYQ